MRTAGPADAAALASLAERTFRDTYSAENSPGNIEAHVARAFSAERQGRELADPAYTTILEEDATGSLIAYAQLRSNPPPVCVPDRRALELWRFYVDRPHHGRGVAQALMAAALDAARKRPASTVWLGVWEKNPRARSFYSRAGFRDVGTHTFVVGTDAQTDRVLVLSL